MGCDAKDKGFDITGNKLHTSSIFSGNQERTKSFFQSFSSLISAIVCSFVLGGGAAALVRPWAECRPAEIRRSSPKLLAVVVGPLTSRQQLADVSQEAAPQAQCSFEEEQLRVYINDLNAKRYTPSWKLRKTAQCMFSVFILRATLPTEAKMSCLVQFHQDETDTSALDAIGW
jgi:hypothetical protein